MLSSTSVSRCSPQVIWRNKGSALWVMSSFLLALAFLVGMVTVAFRRCDMADGLASMLLFTSEKLQRADIPFWLDYGTMLGAFRDQRIVPWEFDLDMGVEEQYCDAVYALKEQFAQEGYLMYQRGEYIPYKAKWGFGGTISMPCIRIYDTRDMAFCTDIYWYKRVNRTTAIAENLMVPDDWQQDDLLCNMEGWTHELPGGCKRRSNVYPLQEFRMSNFHSYGPSARPEDGPPEEATYILPMPKHPEPLLAEMYGEDFMTPKPKGYKALVCRIAWLSGPTYAWLLYALLLFLAFCHFLFALSYFLRAPLTDRPHPSGSPFASCWALLPSSSSSVPSPSDYAYAPLRRHE